ncbi:glycoside hydrolase family 3 protein [Chlorobium sp. N1]|uniref:glycoside hydrolase family 3 protein n=1 Tax=Chlorobium sp. N1 TaxID=2491138 RepID=UPI00103C1293|nr:glycoside hydrolase family 3 protein [Chlorobium sp. N1]TCD47707.1 glycoside hydrolase family 3 protein [Chlorobium sp. N1]
MKPGLPHRFGRCLTVIILLSTLAGGRLQAGPTERPWSPEQVFRANDPETDARLGSMSLEEKVGQMQMADSPGAYTEKDDPARRKLDRLVREGRIGGIMFLKGSMFSAAMLANHFQSIAPIPLFISADMERGLAMRLEGATRFPTAMAVSAAGKPELSAKMGEAIAEEARAAGLHWNFAPSVDLNSNPLNPVINTRSYGDTPEEASLMADALIEGMQSRGLLATAKHFPGHGDVTVDSHLALPVLKADSLRLEAYELKPFRSAVRHGVLAVMTGHLAVPEVTGTMDPASISRPLVTGLLRDKLGFRGLIVTDALNMKALYNGHNVEEISLRAVEAGNDVLLFSPDPDRSFQAIMAAVREGRISEERIDRSVRRILQAKRWLGLKSPALVDLNRVSDMSRPAGHLALAGEIGSRSLTFIGTGRPPFPLRRKKEAPPILDITLEEHAGRETAATFLAGLDSTWNTTRLRLTPESTEAECRAATEAAAEAPAVIISAAVAHPSRLSSLQTDCIRSIAERYRKEKPVVFIAFGSPYMLRSFPEIDCAICTYDDGEESQERALRVLSGKLEARGRLPVSLEMPEGANTTTP